MATFLKFISASAVCSVRRILTRTRPIMTTSFRADQALEQLKCNPHYEKYAQKISHLQNTSPEELISRLEKVHVESTKPVAATTVNEREFSKVAEPKTDDSRITNPLWTKQKLLSNIMKLELLEEKTIDEIKKIWEEYHKQKDVVAATIPSDIYDKLISTSKQFPLFLFPLPRDRGYEFVLCQFAGNEVHFTPLVNYQAHKENAPECLTLVHYSELKEKGLVLMRGEYNKDILDPKEALCLVNQLQLYYCEADEKRIKLMERFSFTPDEFQHMDLVAELESFTSNFYIK